MKNVSPADHSTLRNPAFLQGYIARLSSMVKELSARDKSNNKVAA